MYFSITVKKQNSFLIKLNEEVDIYSIISRTITKNNSKNIVKITLDNLDTGYLKLLLQCYQWDVVFYNVTSVNIVVVILIMLIEFDIIRFICCYHFNMMLIFWLLNIIWYWKTLWKEKCFVIYLLHLSMEYGKSYSLCLILRNKLQFLPARLKSERNIIKALGMFLVKP